VTFLLVTPARDEADRLPLLAASLARQEPGLVGLWVVVDDGSSDGTAEVARGFDLGFPVSVLSRGPVAGAGLATASELVAFRAGVTEGLARLPHPTRIVKLDADLVLDDGYLRALAGVPDDVDLTGGVIVTGADREQADHVRGAVKAYLPAAYETVSALPAALGWDAMDAVAIRAAGGRVEACAGATAELTRRTGGSEGNLLRGRMRGGVVSRWCGYHPAYFLLRLLRYSARRPVVVGAVAMLWAYARAGRGPWPDDLRRAMRTEQSRKLRRLTRRPLTTLRDLFPAR
jgi:dolichol-phosphate mannosyltransferase